MSHDLGPFNDRSDQWKLLDPLVGNSLLELGNKRNKTLTYKAFFQSIGYRHTSVDWNGLDGALPLDLRKPLNLGTFDLVTNFGCTEHVSDQSGVWRNVCDAMHIGSVLVSVTPLQGHWWWHGEWYPTENWYVELAVLNGLSLDRLYQGRDHPMRQIYARMTRVENVPFQMPTAPLFHNTIRPR